MENMLLIIRHITTLSGMQCNSVSLSCPSWPKINAVSHNLPRTVKTIEADQISRMCLLTPKMLNGNKRSVACSRFEVLLENSLTGIGREFVDCDLQRMSNRITESIPQRSQVCYSPRKRSVELCHEDAHL